MLPSPLSSEDRDRFKMSPGD